MKIRVEDVGRDKKTFEVESADNPEAMREAILAGVKKHKALMSRIVDVISNEAQNAGYVVVGEGLRRVGRWMRIEP